MEKKDIKQFLHLYGLGAKVITPDGPGSVLNLHNKIVEVHISEILPNQVMKGIQTGYCMHWKYHYDELTLLCRPLSSLTYLECKELDWAYEGTGGTRLEHRPENLNPKEILFLLSKGFDLFSLIESGLAIDSTLKPV